MKKTIALVTLLLAGLGPIHAQTLVDGERLNNIVIGKSTVADVVAHYGADYKLKKWGRYSNALVYQRLGLTFYSCQGDPKREIFSIVMQAPFEIETSKGIVLGKSTFSDVFVSYGLWNETSAGFEYERSGLYFNHVAEIFSGFEESNQNFDELPATVAANPEPTVVPDKSTVDDRSEFSSDETADMKTDGREENSDDEGLRKVVAEHGDKIVRQIELIEKGGLRQCQTNFR